jgi:hypothetical protein
MKRERWVSYDQLVYYIMTKKRLAGVTMTPELLEVANYEQREKKRDEDEVVFGLNPDPEEKEIEYCIYIS